MDQEESSTLDQVLAQLKYQVVPALIEIKETTKELSSTVGVCLQQDAVLDSRVGTLEGNHNRTTKTIITLGSLIIITLVAAVLDLLSKVRLI